MGMGGMGSASEIEGIESDAPNKTDFFVFSQACNPLHLLDKSPITRYRVI
ncbi:hypothetical protein M7I_7525 [Glarea lozoyensis 74030]|uniref:Uncharacterized protein n=1 Tax=Glarea lozoyensis (strain ATCC 74030 / MF5533) TaxID=1104152 RepID=H0EXI9_GLAL7|nr:hypothetical protein M7I_7525 [Glarea lozoyensis 74030]